MLYISTYTLACLISSLSLYLPYPYLNLFCTRSYLELYIILIFFYSLPIPLHIHYPALPLQLLTINCQLTSCSWWLGLQVRTWRSLQGSHEEEEHQYHWLPGTEAQVSTHSIATGTVGFVLWKLLLLFKSADTWTQCVTMGVLTSNTAPGIILLCPDQVLHQSIQPW